MSADSYITDEAAGETWRLLLGDSCERMAEIPDASVDLSVMSPPFDSLYTYSPSDRDLGNNATRGDFLEHYGFIIRELLRITKPGRVACIHVQQLTTTKATHGYVGLTDFRGDVIRAHEREGWWFTGEVTVNKNPQAQAIRTKSHSLMFVTKNRDSAWSRPALADYLLIFRRPGENTVPVTQTDGHWSRVSNEDWIKLAEPVWWDIAESDTLNERVAREDADERHLCPLQLGFIRNCVRLWSNPGETVFSPFAGIGSELYIAIEQERRALGIELKPSYWRTAIDNLRRLEAQVREPTMLEELEAADA